MAVFSVSSGRQIGVDLKYNSENVNIEGIAQRVFSALEIAAIESLPEDDKRKAFFACWTRKEAYTKAQARDFRSS